MARADWIGETLSGRYEIVELLGQGGMSAVYKANDPNLRRVVAIKLIHPHLSRDPEFVRRFEEEAAAVAQLRHPNLIQVFDFTNDDDTYYIVFEFVAGETLQDRLKRLDESGRPPVPCYHPFPARPEGTERRASSLRTGPGPDPDHIDARSGGGAGTGRTG